ncbi:LacI family DNA-binding transcriptional regulator [Saccharothrix saharensis]|uniref:LacI family DNA-binding transcriptional regulator n=1 Tax=Saccharothrix saharensis TaxID=571190 RepID=UPI003697DDE3
MDTHSGSAPAPGESRRTTLADVARQAGVSKGAASLALNGRTGVSEATRQRVLAVAEQLHWSPNNAARALSAARSDAIGLVLARPARLLSLEPFYMEFISGIEAVLATGSLALLLKVVPDDETETSTYRKWWTGRRVDGVIVTDVRLNDARLPLLAELRLPAVVLGSTPPVGDPAGVTTVWTDDLSAMGSALRYLVGLGHRRLARVAGPAVFAHCAARTAAFRSIAADLGLPAPTVVEADFSGEDGARLTRQLLLAAEPPTAIVYENDVMAVAAVGAAQAVGVRVPQDLSILAWDDSPLCSLTHPTVSAMHRDIPEIGRQVARLLLDAVGGAAPTSLLTAPAELVPRGSTGPPGQPRHA